MLQKIRKFYLLEIAVALLLIIIWQLPDIKKMATITIPAAMANAPISDLQAPAQDSTLYLPIIEAPEPPPSVGEWQMVASANEPTRRHENGYVELNGKFYLIGGRGNLPMDVFDPATGVWSTAAPPPVETHHFQAVVYGGQIYVLGAFTGPFPYEQSIPLIYVYNPITDQWTFTPHLIPEDRRRGSAGAVVYEDKIYLVGGVVGGHGPHATAVPWLDSYDPLTGNWERLPNAPHVRDHFHAAVHGDKLYAVGGRDTGTDNFANNTIGPVDMFDFTTNTWTVLPNPIPTQRAGSMTAVIGDEIIVVGGEGFGQAWPQAEALNVHTLEWRSLAPLNQARHGSQLAMCNDALYVTAGAGAQGGAPELTSQEVFFMDEWLPCVP